MKNKIEDYFFHKENFLDESYCENCIDELNMYDWKKHEWYHVRSDSNLAPSEENEPEVFDDTMFPRKIHNINEYILQKLYPIITKYVENFGGNWFYGWEGFTPLRFNRYFPGQTMQLHCDHIHSMFDGKRRGIPILSIIGILNDDYEGGNLMMFEDKKIDTKKGDILLFPSNFLYPHEITPVTKGVRYSYVSWLW